MSRRRRRSLQGILAVLLVAALALPVSAAFAAQGTPGKPPGVAEETASNNLSVPAIFVGTNPFGLTCDGTAVLPTGVPLTGYTVDGYYYVQKVHTWRAGCLTDSSATVAAAWGDNLSGDAKLKVGSPIRVEMGLDAGAQGLTGFDVVKLEPAQLDRLSPYGTLASVTTTETGTVFAPIPTTPYPETRVWTDGATLKIYPKVDPENVIFNGFATAEINSTGRVVYGYNLRVPYATTYVLEFTAPDVDITTVNKGSLTDLTTGDKVTLEIVVGGGGQGKGKPVR